MWASMWSPANGSHFSRAICRSVWSRNPNCAAISTSTRAAAANLQRLEEVIVLLTLHPLEQKKEPAGPPAEAAGKSNWWDCRGDSMMNDAFDLRLAETHIEVHKFRSGAIVAATFLS